MWAALPADAWRAVSSLCGLGDLARLKACGSHGSLGVALDDGLMRLKALDVASMPLLDAAALEKVFARCPQVESISGVHCGSIFGPVDDGAIAAQRADPEAGGIDAKARSDPIAPSLPALPAACKRLGLRIADTWGPSTCVAFFGTLASSSWVSVDLEHLSLAWNPQRRDAADAQENATSADGPGDSISAAAASVQAKWCLSGLRSLSVHRAPAQLGAAVLSRALQDGACLQGLCLVGVPLPPASSSQLWASLTELSFTCERNGARIDDDFMRILARAQPTLRSLRLVDRREEDGRRGIVTQAGLQALRPILGSLEELRLARTFGVFCDASDVDLMMLLSGAFGMGLKHLDLEGFTRLSDAALLEMLSTTRAGNKGTLQSLRLQGTSVTDATFVNGLEEALAPSLKELRLSSGRAPLGDGALQILAEGGRCRDLERLALGGMNFSDDGLVRVFSDSQRLRALHLREISITDAAILALARGAPRLQEIGISHVVALTDASLDALSGLPLISLRLGACPHLSNRGVANLLEKAGPGLTSLSLEHCNLSNKCLISLPRGTHWPRLQHMRLIGVKVSGPVLDWCRDLQALPLLRRLEVWRSRWPDCFAEAEAEFRRRRSEVVLVLRRHTTMGWTNW